MAVLKNHRCGKIPTAPSSALLYCSHPALLLLFLIFHFSGQAGPRASRQVMGQVGRAACDTRGDEPDLLQCRGLAKIPPGTHRYLQIHRYLPGTGSDSSFSPTSLICLTLLALYVARLDLNLIYSIRAAKLPEVH